MAKPNWRSKKLSAEEKKEIVRLHGEGLRNVDICHALTLNRNTVHLALVKAGLRITRRPPLPEKKVMELLRKGVGARTIGRMLKVSHRHVLEFARQRGFCKPRKEVGQATVLLVVDEILKRKASAMAIAKKHNMPYKRVLEMAHRLLQCEKFLPTWKHPLSSYFPSRPPEPMKPQQGGEEGFIQLVDMLSKIFKDELPAEETARARLLTGLCFRFVPRETASTFTRQQQDQTIEYFQGHILAAMTALRESENARWKN
jgi:transposase-like protein